MIRFAYGGSRWIVLTDRFAFKIARFRPFYCLRRFFEHRASGTSGAQLASYHQNRWLGGIKYVCLGIVANLTESRLYRECPDLRIAPTLFSLLGLINIQLRGEPVEDKDMSLCPFQSLPILLKKKEIGDLNMCKQFARFPNGILLIDYGSESVARALRSQSRTTRETDGLAMTA